MWVYHKGHVLVPYYSSFDINDLPQAVHNSSISMYADDTSLYYQSPYTTQLNKANNNDVTKLESWLKE